MARFIAPYLFMLIDALIYRGRWETKRRVFRDKSLKLHLQNCRKKNGCQGYTVMAVGLEHKNPRNCSGDRNL